MAKPEYNVQIRIDSREHALVDYCKRAWPNGTDIVDWSHQLRYGDIQVSVGVGDGPLTTDLIIERKAAGDFQASVSGKDQRFRKQRSHLIIQRRKYPGVQIMYLLEGDVRELYYEKDTKFTVDYLLDRQDDLTDKYGIPVRFTGDIKGTVRYIIKLHARAKKYGSIDQICARVREDETDALGQPKYRPDVEKAAEAAITPRKFLQHMLVGIWGMTANKALCVVNKYHTLENLIHCYRRLPHERDRENMLRYLKASGDTKRLGPALSKRVYACLIGLNAGKIFKPIAVEGEESEEEAESD